MTGLELALGVMLGATGLAASGALLARWRCRRELENLRSVHGRLEKRHEEVLQGPEGSSRRWNIYDHLWETLTRIRRTGTATEDDIGELYRIRFDAERFFPSEVVQFITQIVRDAITLHVTGKLLAVPPMSADAWEAAAEESSRQMLDLINAKNALVDQFRPHLVDPKPRSKRPRLPYELETHLSDYRGPRGIAPGDHPVGDARQRAMPNVRLFPQRRRGEQSI